MSTTEQTTPAQEIIEQPKNVAVVDNEPKQLVTVAAPVPSEFVLMMERLATNKDVDIVKLNALRDIYNAEQDRAAEKAFYADFVRMKPKLPRVIKLHKNTQTNSKYAKLEDITDTIEPILGEFGFGTSMEVVEQNEIGVKVRVDLVHTAGFIKSTSVFMPWDDKGMAGAKNKTMPHAYSSSIMYARRVGECALLNISTGDDKDGNNPDNKPIAEVVYIDEAKVKEIKDALPMLFTDTKKFMDYMGVDDVAKITVTDLPKAMKMINDRRTLKKKKADEATQKATKP